MKKKTVKGKGIEQESEFSKQEALAALYKSDEAVVINPRKRDLFNLIGNMQKGLKFENDLILKSDLRDLVDILIQTFDDPKIEEILMEGWAWEIPKQWIISPRMPDEFLKPVFDDFIDRAIGAIEKYLHKPKSFSMPFPEPQKTAGGVQILLSRNFNNVTTKVDLPEGATDQDYREAFTRMLNLAQEALDKRAEMENEHDLFDHLRSEYTFLKNNEGYLKTIRAGGQKLTDWQKLALEKCEVMGRFLESIKSRSDWCDLINEEPEKPFVDDNEDEDEDEDDGEYNNPC